MSDSSDELDRPSRSLANRQRKHAENRLESLAKDLIALSTKQLGRLNLHEELVSAIAEARRMSSHAARARQVRIVRRELRASDSPAIAASLDALINPKGPSPAARLAQRWVDRLLAEGVEAIESFLEGHPNADRQHLKVLLRNARTPDPQKGLRSRKALLNAVQSLVADALSANDTAPNSDFDVAAEADADLDSTAGTDADEVSS